jgi:hypothetical protein
MHDGHHHHHHEEESHGSLEKTIAILSYTHDHNSHHTAELESLAQTLESLGKENAGALLRASVETFKQGNDQLAQALKQAQEN